MRTPRSGPRAIRANIRVHSSLSNRCRRAKVVLLGALSVAIAFVGCGDPGPPLLESSDTVEAHCGSGDTPSGGCRCNAYCQNTNCGLCRNGARAALIEPPAQGFTACSGGFAGDYPCFRVDLLSFLPASALGGGTANDIWGWTDPLDGTEFALVGLSNGTAFVSLADPEHPVHLGNLPTHTVNSLWRDIKVYGDHAYIVSEASNHGLQVFDLTQLRSVPNPPATFSETAHYAGFGNAHNLAIDEDTAFGYAVGTSTCNGGPHVVDLADPVHPVFAGCVSGDGYTHDTECVVYGGPDLAYQNHEICFSSNEDTLTIVDVTDKMLPVQLSRTSYVGRGYTHQAWVTEDQRYVLLDDELDELNNGHNTRTYIWDVGDLGSPVVIGSYTSTVPATDHNLYVDGGFVFQANYRAGLRILDLDDVASASLHEVGFFDIYPPDDDASFNGAWSNYPFFASGVVVVSGIEQGLYVLRPDLSANLPTATPLPTRTPTPYVPNLALQKPASQSSTIFGATADRAVDGNTNGNWGGQSVSHTDSDPQAWWQVDLGAVSPISSIAVWNRTDCCGERLSNFYVLVSDTPFASTDLAATLAQPGVQAYFVDGQGGSPSVVPVAANGRYVRVQLSGTGYLSLAEVQVFGLVASPPPTAAGTATRTPTPSPTATRTPTGTATGPPAVNLAPGGFATQSSTGFGGVPERAVDGDTNGNFGGSSVTHTLEDVQAWWQLDLGAVASIGDVAVWNRTDCCGSRLHDFYVFVSDAPFGSTAVDATLGQAGVSAFFVSGAAGRPSTVAVQRSGRYVRVQITGTDFLSLAEVQVFAGGALGTPSTTPITSRTATPTAGSPTPSPTPTIPPAANLAAGKVASQSSTIGGGDAARAVDGNTSGVWAAGSVTHTDEQAQPWWQVDLGSVASIDSISLWNRTDCCSARLSSFYVLVSDVPFASGSLSATLAQAGVSAFFVSGPGGQPTAVAIGRSGRYVRVQLSGSDYLSLAEVQVLATTQAGTPAPTATGFTRTPTPTATATATVAAATNLALGGVATQSSTLLGAVASRAIDGNTSGNWSVQSVTHTDADSGAWWQVDLGSIRALSSVAVWNRTDCCSQRLSNYYVLVSDVPFVSTDLAATLAQPGVSTYFQSVVAGSPTVVAVPRTGRFVRLQLTEPNYLSLAEVQVF